MTDPIPQVYLDEAVRRLNAFSHCYSAEGISAQVLARTLQELGWTPPVDPVEQRAKEIAARAYGVELSQIDDGLAAYQAALIALREGMGE